MSDQPPVPRAAPLPARALRAYVGPFGAFILLNLLPDLVRSASPAAPWWLHTPEFWVYPLQTAVSAAILLHYRREYPLALTLRAALAGLAVGTLVFALWVSPQTVFHFAPRTGSGFDPTPLRASHPSAYFWTVALRFVRLAVVVPFLEEIFWRGFLLRFLIREDFLSVPFGSWTRLSFGVVVLGFVFEHHSPDWPAALATGVLYNLVAVRTRSLPACVLAHALTNALLGWYVMATRQWGFW